MSEVKGEQGEIASKRVALTPGTWAALSEIKPPGKSLGDTVAGLIAEHRMQTPGRELDGIDAKGHFIPWDEAKKKPGP